MGKLEQEHRIKQLLAQRRDSRGRRMNMTSLAKDLDEAYGTVAGVVYGNRINPAVRAKIAEFLGQTVEELFGDSIRSAGETPAPTTPAPLEVCSSDSSEPEVSHG